MSSGPSSIANTVRPEFSDPEAGGWEGTREDRAQGAGKVTIQNINTEVVLILGLRVQVRE